MKTLNITVFPYSELSITSQRKAVEHFRYINVDNVDWWEGDFIDFVALCTYIGIDVHPKQIFFNGFYSQSDGSCFFSYIDIPKMIDGISKKRWREIAPNLLLEFDNCPIPKRIVKLIEVGAIDYYALTNIPKQGYYIDLEIQFFLGDKTYKRIEEALNTLKEWLQESLENINHHLFCSLRNSYETLIGDEAIANSLITNEYLFTKDGYYSDYLMQKINITEVSI